MSEKRARNRQRRARRARRSSLRPASPAAFAASRRADGYAVDALAVSADRFNEMAAGARGEGRCSSDSYGLLVNVTPESGDWLGEVLTLQIPLADRPSAAMGPVLEHVAARLGIPGDRLDALLVNDVPEWQVDPDEPAVESSVGHERLAAAASDDEPPEILAARRRIDVGIAQAWRT